MSTRRPILIACHPGHELLVHGWMEQAKPLVLVLTDGSGSRAVSRIGSTGQVVARAGAVPGPVFGRYTDADLYGRLRSHDDRFFVALAEELAAAIADSGADLIVADAAEGYNSGHDVCRLLADAAVALAAGRTGRAPKARAVALMGAAPHAPSADRIPLTADALRRKLAAARGYPELAGEVERALATQGEASFADEWLLPVPTAFLLSAGEPYYERYGADRVSEGAYPAVIRRAAHLAPLAEVLRRHVAGATRCAA